MSLLLTKNDVVIVRNSAFPFESGRYSPSVRVGCASFGNALQLYEHIKSSGKHVLAMGRDPFICAFIETEVRAALAHLNAHRGRGTGELNDGIVPFGLGTILGHMEGKTRDTVDAFSRFAGLPSEQTCEHVRANLALLISRHLHLTGAAGAGPFMSGAKTPALEDILLFAAILEADNLEQEPSQKDSSANGTTAATENGAAAAVAPVDLKPVEATHRASLDAHFDAVLAHLMSNGTHTKHVISCTIHNPYVQRDVKDGRAGALLTKVVKRFDREPPTHTDSSSANDGGHAVSTEPTQFVNISQAIKLPERRTVGFLAVLGASLTAYVVLSHIRRW